MATICAFDNGKEIALPEPTALSSGDEIIWSSNTGRNRAGVMKGKVITEKKTISITWEFLTESEVKKIKKYLTTGFYKVKHRNYGEDITISVYRGSMQKEHMTKLAGGICYRTVTCEIVQQ